MASSDVQRKLTAILCADVVGYSRLMGANEKATLRTLTDYRQVFADSIEKFRGRIVNAPGDSILAEFASVVDAVEGAVEIQRDLADRNAEMLENRRMLWRIGINLGDVMVQGEDLYGDGVNIAARLESLAEPGGISISGFVYEQVKQKLKLHFEYMGEQQVKNIVEPVKTYQVPTKPGDAGHRVVQARKEAIKPSHPIKLPDKPSIAVLAFQNMSGDTEQEYFSDGISEDIITDLSSISGLLVIARNSSFVYKGRAVDVRQVGQELGVGYVLEGSVRKVGNRVRITAQLIDTVNGNHIWANRFDRTLEDIFAVQDEITEEIVTSLNVKLLEGELQRVWRKYLKTYEARALYNSASQFFAHLTKQESIDARQKFERVMDLEPDSPVGYNGMGWSHLYDARYGWSDDPARSLALASDRARESLEKEGHYPAANILLAVVFLLEGEFERAIEVGKQAEALAPNHAHNVAHMALILNYTGHQKEAISKIQKAIRIIPSTPAWYLALLASASFGCGRYEEAIRAAAEGIEINQEDMEARLYKAAAHEVLGQHDEAVGEVKTTLMGVPDYSLSAFAKTQPFKDRAVLDGLLDLLRNAGLPE